MCPIPAKKFQWDPDETSMLSLGFSLKPGLADRLSNILQFTSFQTQYYPILTAYKERLGLIAATGAHTEKATPLKLLYWIKRLEFTIPDNLERNVQYFQQVDKNDKTEKLVQQGGIHSEHRQFLQSERTTALKLIAAMAVKGYAFKPNAERNAATSDIQTDLNLLGLEMDNKTILKWIREACELLDLDNIS